MRLVAGMMAGQAQGDPIALLPYQAGGQGGDALDRAGAFAASVGTRFTLGADDLAIEDNLGGEGAGEQEGGRYAVLFQRDILPDQPGFPVRPVQRVEGQMLAGLRVRLPARQPVGPFDMAQRRRRGEVDWRLGDEEQGGQDEAAQRQRFQPGTGGLQGFEPFIQNTSHSADFTS